MNESHETSNWVVSYSQLGLIILVFVLGVISALLISNAQIGTPTTFTTTELVGFVLSVILSGASIVLAVSAIALGKSSEQSVIRRSDESIRLQNEVFIKTTEALQRIEASTGVTEKRIEDIISGRVGDISHQIAEMATRGGRRRPQDTKELEENIRQSLLRTIRSDANKGKFEEAKSRKEEDDKKEEVYQQSHEKVLLGIGNKEGFNIKKLGHGKYPSEGEDLLDAIYTIEDKQIGISTFRPETKMMGIGEYIDSAAAIISSGEFYKIYMILFEHSGDDRIIGEIKQHLDLLKVELSSRIEVITLEYGEIDKWIDNFEL